MKTIINIKADKEVKEGAQKVAKELGLPLSTIINAYLKQFMRNREAYFSIAPRMTPELEELIGITQRDYVKKKNISPLFSSAKDAIAYLRSK